MVRDADTAEIRERLEGEVERLLDELTPGWVRRRATAFLWPHGSGDPGSGQLALAGPRQGLWYRHSQKVGGDLIALIAYVRSGEATAVPDADTFAWAREFLGIDSPAVLTADERAAREAERERRRAAAAEREKARARQHAEARLRQRIRAREIWRAGMPADGTLVEAWLSARGIDLATIAPLWASTGCRVPPSLRFHDAMPYMAGGEEVHCGPAMLAAIQHGEHGGIIGVHITWLSRDGREKAAIAVPAAPPTPDPSPPRGGEHPGGAETPPMRKLPARKIRGDARGGHVRFGAAGPTINVAEGLETSLSFAEALALSGAAEPVWAALSLGNLDAPLPAPGQVRTVRLAFDSDERRPEAAAKTKQAAIDAHVAAGRRVLWFAPPEGMDLNSWAQSLKEAGSGACPGHRSGGATTGNEKNRVGAAA